MRFALEGDQVTLDTERRMPGRGAWLHPDRECFDTALRRRAFARAFRRAVETAHLTFEDVAPLTGSQESGLESVEHPMSTDG